MDEQTARVLVKYFSTPKNAGYTYIRESELMQALVKKLMRKYNLTKSQQVYEMAILNLSLGIPLEELAPLFQRYKRHSKESLFRIVEYIVNVVYLTESKNNEQVKTT